MAWPKGKLRKLTPQKMKGIMARLSKGQKPTEIAKWAGVTPHYVRLLNKPRIQQGE